MPETIPIHTLSDAREMVPALKIYRFKNSPGSDNTPPLSLPITPLPTDKPHSHNYYEMLFIEEGKGFHEVDFHSHAIVAPALHFVRPGQVHLLHFTSSCQGFIMAFPEEFHAFFNPQATPIKQHPAFREGVKHPFIALSGSEKHYLHNILENMSEDFLKESEASIMGRYLDIILQKISAMLPLETDEESNSAQHHPAVIGRFQELVEKHFLQWHEVQQYARELTVTPDYLTKVIKKYLRTSCQDYILDKLLLEAKRLLVFTNLSNKEIAYHIHIEDPSYFGRIFKKKTGLTPNAYREQVRKSAIH